MDPAISPAGRRALAVVFAIVLGGLYLPFVIAFAASLSPDPNAISLGDATLHWYRAVLGDNDLRDAFVTGVWVAAIVAVIDVLAALGLALAIALPRPPWTPRTRGLIVAGTLVPLVLPPAAYASMMLAFSLAGPYRISFGLHFVVAAHVTMFLPFAVLLVLPGVRAIGLDLFETAQDLGASTWTLVRRLVLPLAGRAIAAAYLVVFVFSFNEPVASAWLMDKQPTFAAWLWGLAKLTSDTAVTSVITVLGCVAALAVALALRGARASLRAGR